MLMQNWNVIVLNFISFFDRVALAERFCMVVNGTLRQSVGFPGAILELLPAITMQPKYPSLRLDDL